MEGGKKSGYLHTACGQDDFVCATPCWQMLDVFLTRDCVWASHSLSRVFSKWQKYKVLEGRGPYVPAVHA